MARCCCVAAAIILALSAPVCGERQFETDAQLGLFAIQGALDAEEITPSQAIRRYRLLIRRYRDEADVIAEANLEIALLSENLGRMNDAIGSYLAVLKYPGSVFYLPAADALHQIGLNLLEQRRGGLFRDNYAGARRVFEALTKVFPEPAKTAEFHYRMGLCSLEMGKYPEAEIDFGNVLERFPVEPWKEKASFRLGDVYYNMRRPPTRDQTGTERAITHFETFLRQYPESDFAEDASGKLAELNENMAEYLFNVCSFYLNRGDEEAAGFYYRILTGNYPGSRWEEIAGERFKID